MYSLSTYFQSQVYLDVAPMQIMGAINKGDPNGDILLYSGISNAATVKI